MKNLTKLLVMIVVLCLTTQLVWADEKVPVLKVGDSAPTFFLRDLDGENFFLSKTIKQKQVIVLSFYATWCIPCRTEIPAYEKLLAETEFEAVKLIYIHVGEPKVKMEDPKAGIELIHKMKANLKMSHPILFDRYGVVADKYGASSLPTTVVIGPDGKVHYYHSGFKPGDGAKVKEVLLKILK
ncbi:MAG: TlpA disulfide reductase family protein [Candidatus Marinimicrobia bacterium]|nr:TlpA disulfide reductase family protein [Candidatus Neomarinimicrobiota bacterium]